MKVQTVILYLVLRYDTDFDFLLKNLKDGWLTIIKGWHSLLFFFLKLVVLYLLLRLM